MIWWTDGSGWNGRKAEWLVCNEEGKVYRQKFTDERTNNEMEYGAVIDAIGRCQKGDEIRSDSQLVVNQISGAWKCKEARLFPFMQTCRLLSREKNIKVVWIPREENMAGKMLEAK